MLLPVMTRQVMWNWWQQQQQQQQQQPYQEPLPSSAL